jgi:folate-binding protein YgfZ
MGMYCARIRSEAAQHMPDLALTTLDDLSVIGVRGADAVSFLQGQVSQDLQTLAEHGNALAGLHNPQGRCIAVLRIFRVAPDQLLLVLPADLAEAIRVRLTRYVLRARVALADASATWRVYGVSGPAAAAASSTRLSMAMDHTGMRHLIVAPRGEPLPEGETTSRQRWRLDDIAAGLPEIRTATSAMFVAQMLNLDLLGAIAFDKGCYTGQEVIARAHYRGQVKRRAQRFATESEQVLLPGVRLRLGDGRSAQVVMAAQAEGGGQQFLAVTTAPGSGAALTDESGESPSTVMLECEQLPLPYALPA